MFFFQFFLFISPQDLRAPSADPRKALPHNRYMAEFYNASPKIPGPSHNKNFGAKTCKIWGDFTQLPTLIANISATTRDIQNRKDMWSRLKSDSSRVQRNKSGKFWSTIHKVGHVSLHPPKSTFSRDYISATRGCWFLKFLHALQIGQGLLVHTTNRVGVPKKF